MSSRVAPAVLATGYAVVLAVLLFLPFVVREYRMRGELGAGTALLRFGALLYALALVCYVLSPFPQVSEGFCAAVGPLPPQWRPLASFDGASWPDRWTDVARLLAGDGSVQQFALNVVLFVPLGVVLRRWFGRGIVSVALLGCTVSLAIELTQLTGNWFLYPCPYRLFDVDGLIANTAGALLGRVLAPVVVLVPGRRTGVEPDFPRPVSRFRRYTGMSFDLVLLWWIGGIAGHGLDLALRQGILAQRPWLQPTALWFGPAVLLLLVTVIGGGSTLGQRAVLLRSVRSPARRPPVPAVLSRWSAGLGGLALVQGILYAVGLSMLWLPLTVVWAAVHGWGVLSDHRGFTGRFAGLLVIDARIRSRQERLPPPDSRRTAAASGPPRSRRGTARRG